MDKNSAYVRTLIALHKMRDTARESVNNLQETFPQRIANFVNGTRNTLGTKTGNFFSHPDPPACEYIPDKYSYIFRSKSTWELILLSGTVCGIEFCYSAETAFVTPILLSLGLNIKYVSMMWCLSPIVGFFITPLLGSLSDSCTSRYGRRRPFILLLSIGIILGLTLVPNGRYIGLALGDNSINGTDTYAGVTDIALGNISTDITEQPQVTVIQPWSLLFTILGTVLLDSCSDACQSPSRTYLLDVSLPQDHASGLSTFTLMAGLGGSAGYMMGAIHWSPWAQSLQGHVNVVFLIVTVIFVLCLLATLRSFPEMTLTVLRDPKAFQEYNEKLGVQKFREQDNPMEVLKKNQSYGTIGETSKENGNHTESTTPEPEKASAPTSPESTQEDHLTFTQYLKSIIYMPASLRKLCLTNLFCWMSLVCYSLYFTDFVGESVYGGDPTAPVGSQRYQLYKDGVQFGCWGMALYSLSCSTYSYFIEALVKKLGAKPVYIGGQLVYTIGMVLMAVTRHPVAVILLSPTAGVMYSTLFTMPYLLIARYHCTNKFVEGNQSSTSCTRGIGTDVATVSSMVFLSQFVLSLSMGSIVDAVGSNVATVCAAAVLSACGAVSATQVLYLDL